MPSYNYHIKFELYSTPDPTSDLVAHDDITAIWVPDEGSGIFDELPLHPRKHELKPAKSQQTELGLLQDKGKYASTSVIDCGIDRARSVSPSDESIEPNLVRLTERQWRDRRQSIPPPGFKAGLGPDKASRDWRFGRVSVESFDTELAHSMAGSGRRQENDDEAGGQGPRPAPSLGPTFGGPGQSTKGRYVPLETKNTEVGWGIVHLYREGENGLETGVDGETVDGGSGGAGQKGEAGDDEDDGPILCIPAVPTYLSPSDFLGFVGEKWRGDVCHYRMVMTSRMNRYMVLMKFTDKWRAAEWRKEFDGKAFNGMEVSDHVWTVKR
jgi:BRCA1-associated protein